MSGITSSRSQGQFVGQTIQDSYDTAQESADVLNNKPDTITKDRQGVASAKTQLRRQELIE